MCPWCAPRSNYAVELYVIQSLGHSPRRAPVRDCSVARDRFPRRFAARAHPVGLEQPRHPSIHALRRPALPSAGHSHPLAVRPVHVHGPRLKYGYIQGGTRCPDRKLRPRTREPPPPPSPHHPRALPSSRYNSSLSASLSSVYLAVPTSSPRSMFPCSFHRRTPSGITDAAAATARRRPPPSEQRPSSSPTSKSERTPV